MLMGCQQKDDKGAKVITMTTEQKTAKAVATVTGYFHNRKQLEQEMVKAIEHLRSVGHTWEAIGLLADIGDRRAAEQWYRRHRNT